MHCTATEPSVTGLPNRARFEIVFLRACSRNPGSLLCEMPNVVSNGVAPVRSKVKYEGYTSPSNPRFCAALAISRLISYEWRPARNSMCSAMSRLSNSVTCFFPKRLSHVEQSEPSSWHKCCNIELVLSGNPTLVQAYFEVLRAREWGSSAVSNRPSPTFRPGRVVLVNVLDALELSSDDRSTHQYLEFAPDIG